MVNLLVARMVNEWPTEPLHGSRHRKSRGCSTCDGCQRGLDGVRCTLNALKSSMQADRLNHVKSKFEKNRQTVKHQVREVEKLAKERGHQQGAEDEDGNTSRNKGKLAIYCGHTAVSIAKIPQIYSRLTLGNSDARKVIYVDIVRLEVVKRVPIYTAWMFVKTNQLMTRDQSITLRKRITYESNGKETVFCLDLDGEAEENEEDNCLSKSEEFISRMAILEHGASREVLQTIADFLQVPVEKVKSKFQSSKEGSGDTYLLSASRHPVTKVFQRRSTSRSEGVKLQAPSREDISLPPTLSLAMNSFDRLFCRRCLSFNCSMHSGEVKETVAVADERHPPVVLAEGPMSKQCSPECHTLCTVSDPEDAAAWTPGFDSNQIQEDVQQGTPGRSVVDIQELEAGGLWCDLSNQGESPVRDELEHCKGQQAEWISITGTAKKVSDDIVNAAKKISHAILSVEVDTTVERAVSSSHSTAYRYEGEEHTKSGPQPYTDVRSMICLKNNTRVLGRNQKGEVTSDHCVSANGGQLQNRTPHKPMNHWSRYEKDLCEKGIQIFGKDSCVIARNILKGCKSCKEIAEYISYLDVASSLEEEVPSAHHSYSGARSTGTTTANAQTRPSFRRKGKFGKRKGIQKSGQKGLSKSAREAIRKSIKDGGVDNREYTPREYTPCSCDSRLGGCEINCPCVSVNNRCEKYCACSKVCKNRFRGCQCSKSMCHGRHCPCFVADRECDPDLCKFCWFDCGGHTTTQGCQNMKILQHKKTRLLLAHSEVCMGWGVFTRDCLNKNQYIGEYTGEVIPRSEAELRGIVFDRETSFLFDLNDKFVVDAFRKGNKLKFANHSKKNPNCYARVLLVAGDHRLGIFAKEKIEAGQELLYDYQYKPESAPGWATTLIA